MKFLFAALLAAGLVSSASAVGPLTEVAAFSYCSAACNGLSDNEAGTTQSDAYKANDWGHCDSDAESFIYSGDKQVVAKIDANSDKSTQYGSSVSGEANQSSTFKNNDPTWTKYVGTAMVLQMEFRSDPITVTNNFREWGGTFEAYVKLKETGGPEHKLEMTLDSDDGNMRWKYYIGSTLESSGVATPTSSGSVWTAVVAVTPDFGISAGDSLVATSVVTVATPQVNGNNMRFDGWCKAGAVIDD